MSLSLDLIRTLQKSSPDDAWGAILDHAWKQCSQPIQESKGISVIQNRDRSLGDIDHYLATAGWDLWNRFEQTTPNTSKQLTDWWAAHPPGRAILILDALSLRECPWILQQAEARGYTIQQARPTTAELPADTTPFALALGFTQRSALENNGAPENPNFPGAHTESANIAWEDCANLIGAEPDWLFWHHWPDHHLHDHDGPGKGIKSLTEETEQQLNSDAFWSLVERLSTGRRLIITADHGYAASGLFPDSVKAETDYLKKTYKSGRSRSSNEPAGYWVPPIDLSIESRHGRHLYVNGRRKWKSPGGYPTLTHGGLTLLEVTVPFIELSRNP